MQQKQGMDIKGEHTLICVLKVVNRFLSFEDNWGLLSF